MNRFARPGIVNYEKAGREGWGGGRSLDLRLITGLFSATAQIPSPTPNSMLIACEIIDLRRYSEILRDYLFNETLIE